MDRIERIQRMEERMDRAAAALGRLERALEEYEKCRSDLAALREYLGGEAWREDFAADEAGELPPEVKRGVLSEDGLYDLLGRADELRRTMERLARE